MAKTVIVFDPIYPSAPSTRIRLADAAADALVAAGSAVFPVLETSLSSGVVVPPLLAPVNTVLPAISGTVQEGQTVSCSTGSWSNAPTGYAHQWRRDGVAIAGSTFATRLLVSADVNAVLTCAVTATNLGGSTTAVSAAVGPVVAASTPVPVNTVAPVVSGTGAIGQTLSTTNGTWSNSPAGYAYQWRRDGVNIAGATASTYQLVAADGGTSTTCRVTATNAGGSAGATSNAIAVAAPGANPTAAPAGVTYAAQWHPNSGAMTNFASSPAAVGDPVATLAERNALANIVGADAASAPLLAQDALGRKYLNFRSSRYATIDGTTTTGLRGLDSQNMAVFMVVRSHKLRTTPFFYPRYQSDGTTANASFLGALRLAAPTGGTGVYPATGGSATNAGSTTTGGDRAEMLVGSNICVLGMVSRTTANGGVNLLYNGKVATTAAQVTARTGMIGAVLGASPGTGSAITLAQATNIATVSGFDLMELIVVQGNVTDAQAASIVANLRANWADIATYTDQLVLEGTSITDGIVVRFATDRASGVESDQCMGALLTRPGAMLVPPTTKVVTLGTSGNKVSDMALRRDGGNTAPNISPFDFKLGSNDPGKNIVLPEAARNDYAAAIASADHYINVKALAHTGSGTGYLERGWNVAVPEPIAGSPSYMSDFLNDYRARLNGGVGAGFVADMIAIAAGYAGRVAVLRMSQIAVSGQTIFEDAADATNLTYYQQLSSNPAVTDATHENPLGALRMADGGDTPQYGVRNARASFQ